MHTALDNATIRVEIDRELQSIIPGFLECRRTDCELIVRLLEDGGLEEIERLGHRLKGAGGSYGFDVISEIGMDLERAAINGDHDAIVRATRMLQRYLERITVVYVSDRVGDRA